MHKTNKTECKNRILKVENLSKTFNLEAGFFAKNNQTVYAVNNVSFDVMQKSTFGLVGESGCGKTTTVRLIIKMYDPTKGSIIFSDKGKNFDVVNLKGRELKDYREKVKYIFQDPARSLNSRMNVFDILTSALHHSPQWKDKKDALDKAIHVIEEVGLSKEDIYRHPSEFSGGQRQRISIARGLIMQPSLLICDEVVSALDVSIQGQIINLLQELKEKHNLSYIFITHDLKIASYFCDYIGVMYRGILVEEAPAKNLYKTAFHPYTKLLFEGAKGAMTDSCTEVKTVLKNQEGCPFANRCPHIMQKCRKTIPDFKYIDDIHKVRCFLA